MDLVRNNPCLGEGSLPGLWQASPKWVFAVAVPVHLNKPARTTVEVMLNSPELLVAITVNACIPD
jgi:hypothetical protein